MKLTKIKINANDIFDYVVRNTNYDPIERCIDPTRYEIFDVSIYDHKAKVFYDQSDQYKNFCSQVSKLRSNTKEMMTSEIISICKELEEIAPTEVNLTEPISHDKQES